MRFLVCICAILLLSCDSARPSADVPAQEEGVESGLPGAPSMSKDLLSKIDTQRESAMAGGLELRTRHKGDDGQPSYTNRLILESSPYLRQHAFNPVDWHPWGDAAFAKAKQLNRPILLSIGYSTCHWCHVMEHESFEDVEIATFMNANYIAIKVDREERPDIDEIYMSAVRAMSGSAGWPTTVWLTPEGAPFMGGTYFPARAGDRGAKKGFLDLLKELAAEYQTSPEAIAAKGEALSKQLRAELEAAKTGQIRNPIASLHRAVEQYSRAFDDSSGGWGARNKFPMPSRLRLLLRFQNRAKKPDVARKMVFKTLDEMAAGGIYDQIGGGFHRYTVDRNWTVPHFEKMLYDNAQLVLVYTDAWLATRNPVYKRVVYETLTYLLREMQDPTGAFWAASDAQGEGEEGTYFTWTKEEAATVLTPEELAFAEAHWGLGVQNFEGRTVLRVAKNKDQLDATTFSELRASAQTKLLSARQKREYPHVDTKLISGWNGLALEALSRAAFVFGEQTWRDAALKLGALLTSEFMQDGLLLRSRTGGEAGPVGFSDDYVFVISGLIELFQLSGDTRWLEAAKGLQKTLDTRFWDQRGGYFRTGTGASESLLARTRPAFDGAIPSPNSYGAYSLARLHKATLDDDYDSRLKSLFEGFGDVLNRGGGQMPMMMVALDFRQDLAKEVVVVLPDGSEDALTPVISQKYYPNLVHVTVPEAGVDHLSTSVPWAKAKKARKGQPTAYVCRNSVCKLPTSDPLEFAKQLGEINPL